MRIATSFQAMQEHDSVGGLPVRMPVAKADELSVRSGVEAAAFAWNAR
jgi:hypothetical protein